MSETAAGKSNTIATAVEKGATASAADRQMPTKHYAESTKMATTGKAVTIDGPCSEHGGRGVYHQGGKK